MRKVTKKDKRRLFVLLVIFIPILTVFVSNMVSYWTQIFSNIKEKTVLEKEYKASLEKESILKSDITKLQDDEYIAKYAREKYMYSKDNELIIKLK